MKQLSLLAAILGLAFTSFAQLNTKLVSNLPYASGGNSQPVNDIWGYVAEDETEYAIVGLNTGVSVVSLADPATPREVAFLPGPSSGWRDMKTWGNFAYATNETDQGLLVADLSMLPDSVPFYYWSPTIPELGGELSSCHNIYIDEFGYAYLAGCNLNSGGPIFVDVFSDPGNPIYAGKGDARYAHDIYTRDNMMYGSDIYDGFFSVTDVTDKSNPVLLATQGTPFDFTHNAWLSDDGNTLFTTDERGNAPTAAYDISDLNDIKFLDEFRPINTIGEGVIPHNAHVLNDYLVISHYTDGLVIVDASRPSNLIEVGHYDTFNGGNGGFGGCWGAYPFLPSGLVLASDRSGGLFVVEPTYTRACFLEGIVRSAETMESLSEVEVSIVSDDPNLANTGLDGRFATGQATPGTFSVTFSKFGFQDKTIEVELENGVVNEIEVELEPQARFAISGQILSAMDGTPIPNAQISMISEEATYPIFSAEDGTFTLSDIVQNEYEVFIGAWGYLYQTTIISPEDAGAPLVYRLEEGFVDDFALNLGWMTGGTASTGLWEHANPIFTGFGQSVVNPSEDLNFDIGDKCFVTGNGGGGAGDDDIDDGDVVLISPMMDLTDYINPVLSYYTWFYNGGGNSALNDRFDIYLSNGTDQILLETIDQSRSRWEQSSFNLAELGLELTAEMSVIFIAGDYSPGHLVEAGVDLFSVVGDRVSNTNEVLAAAIKLEVLPNPFTEAANINIELPKDVNLAQLEVYNLLGQLIESRTIGNQANLQLGTEYVAGTYFVNISVDGITVKTEKLIKQ